MIRDCSNLYFCCPLPKDYQNFLIKNAAFSKTDISRTAALTDDADLAISEKAAGPYRALESYIGSDYMTPAADVYSLCCVMYRAVTGSVPCFRPRQNVRKNSGMAFIIRCSVSNGCFRRILEKRTWRLLRPPICRRRAAVGIHWHSCDRPPRHHLQGGSRQKSAPCLAYDFLSGPHATA